jgi:RND family efflux transporter MFP subunit
MSEQPDDLNASRAVDDLGFALPQAGRSSRLKVIAVAVVLVGAGLAFGIVQYRKAQGNVPVVTGERTSRVEVIKPTELASDRAYELPGTVRALEETKVYPRVSGYVRRWLVDIGDKVKEGQLLAEIETPELDAQLSQARAVLAQARATVKQATAQRDYSKSNTARYEGLSDQKLVSKGQVEQTQAQAKTDEANLNAAESNVTGQEANVRRLGELAGFAKVIAPFAGTVTLRSVDRGALVTEGNATAMFTIIATDPVRIYVDVPQTVAAGIRDGMAVTITVRELPNKKLTGTVARSAGALDPDLHTLKTEIRVPNPDGVLLPGMYVQAQLALSVPHHTLEIPATALYNDAQGMRVAVVDAQSKVKFAPITIERDTGATLQVAGGLTGTERIIKIAVPSLVEGDTVEVVAAPGSGSAR